MLFIVFNTDKSNSAELRDATRAAHLAYLKEAGSKVKIGGPTVGADGKSNGGVMVIEADSFDEARSFASADPFAKAGLFDSTVIRQWKWMTGNPDPAR